tara:strand:- start:54315 stop:55286 length:972 start_codon:yes stop_codon:yes gene_type:complete
MKKIYLGAFALIAGINISAQTIDFESTILTTNSYNNGSDLSGGFTYDGIHFSNYYDTTYFYNEGFSISNVQDNTTPGWGNQYSSMANGGYLSANYAIFYPSGNIDLSSTPRYVESMRITNSTYAALSMKNGDAVGKKFGSIYDANGIIDGTNGNDFLKLTIHSLSILGDTMASIDYYLADFRFADSTLDYIVEDWDLLDLTSLNIQGESIAYLVFKFESSDIGQFGINTPTYFAMDDLKYANGTASIAEEMAAEWKVYPNPFVDIIHIEGVSGKIIIRNLEGRVVYQADSLDKTIYLENLPSGIYTVFVESANKVSTKRIVKL